jgi:hypothetical protein
MKNQIQIDHEYFVGPDDISVNLNGVVIYSGPANIEKIDFYPSNGTNILTVTLDKKQSENFKYDSVSNQLLKNSTVKIKEIIVEDRYFRSLVIKCGLVEVDLEKNLGFPSKYIDHENCLALEGSIYLIKFDCPIKHWMQVHLHGRNLRTLQFKNQRPKDLLEHYQNKN